MAGIKFRIYSGEVGNHGVTNDIYTTGGITTRIAGRYDDRGNLLADIDRIQLPHHPDYHGLATQCNRGSDGSDGCWAGGDDDDTVGEANTENGTSADGPICFRPPNDLKYL